MATEDAASFMPLSFTKQAHGHLLVGACSPDKDLFVLLVTAQNKDRLSLWKTVEGSKVWEVDVCQEVPMRERVTAIAWAPDGMRLVLAHQPPRLSVHSVQDGARLTTVQLSINSSSWLTGVWWLKNTHVQGPSIWRREDITPGSALSTLQSLPLLDYFPDYSRPQSESFAFGSHNTPAQSDNVPTHITQWPCLGDTLRLASIASSDFNIGDDADPEDGGRDTDLNDQDEDPIRDSLVVASDSAGSLHLYLDGSFPVGHLDLQASSGGACRILGLSAPPAPATGTVPLLAVHALHRRRGTNAIPQHIRTDLLAVKATREMVRASSVARDLIWYALRVIKSMREIWLGRGPGDEGSHVLGRKFTKLIEERMRAHSKQVPHPVYELSSLLLTGKASDGLIDILSSPQQPVNLSRWEVTMTDALVRIRDYTERRVTPACQRLIVVMQEVRGWSQLPHVFGAFSISESHIVHAIAETRRAIELCAFLASTVRDELEGFKHFVSWLKTEMSNVVAEQPPPYIYRHDPLVVSEYLQRSLESSFIDPFFDSMWRPSSPIAVKTENDKTAHSRSDPRPVVPHISPSDIRAPEPSRNLDMVLVQARQAIKQLQEAKGTWQPVETTLVKLGHQRPTVESLDRNLVALLGSIAGHCQACFAEMATAPTTTARIAPLHLENDIDAGGTMVEPDSEAIVLCDRVKTAELEDSCATLYSAVLLPGLRKLCFLRTTYTTGSDEKTAKNELSGTILDCAIDSPESTPVELMAVEFFDDEVVAIVYRPEEADSLYLALADYASASYAALPSSTGLSRESAARQLAQALPSTSLSISGTRKLRCSAGMRDAAVRTAGAGVFGADVEDFDQCKSVVQLAVNGRVGRRVVCVYQRDTGELETFDMEGTEDDEDDEAMGDE
ncbi:anaphase-promoting complex, cyclosome, subunit 4-domain-containing protein [Auriculariales sp. MPI-PUGE-AT-0066]|nr:anaphase-promoting complex, cyclosome, subunit 4-domain-containing protein [Auriculariales sp. MPI-PUGE-AT-0066]